MARKLRTKKGKAIYARRKVDVEPVIGQMKGRQNAGRSGSEASTAPAENGSSTVAAAIVVVRAGVGLARAGDELAVRTGLGRLLVGMLLRAVS